MKKQIFSLFFALMAFTFVNAQEGLGLAERRALKAYQDEQYPAMKKAIEDGAGYQVSIEVMWEQIAKPGKADKYKEPEYFENTLFKPVALALQSITKDAMGKTALKAKLKKIIFLHDAKTAPVSNWPNGLKMENGVLTVNWTPYENCTDSYIVDRTKELVNFIEEKL
jgi:hypothetical protein